MPFTAICDCHFGREIIYTNATEISEANIVKELNAALTTHRQNAIEIEYLNNYYCGDQPILYRQKKNRPEVNNKVVVNIAKYVVDTLTSETTGEPIQYVLRGTDKTKTNEINRLNGMMYSESKDYCDTELVRWRKICGTAYRFVGINKVKADDEESPFFITYEDPRDTFVCYFANTKKPAFSCQIRTDETGKQVYNVYTNTQYFLIKDSKVVSTEKNGNFAIPVIEYPNNARRLSDIETTIMLTDEINKLSSDRANAVEQYVCSWIKFINCEIDIDKFRELRDEGFFSVTTNEGSTHNSDVDIMAQELNQSETQVEIDDLFNKLLLIHGIANREGNTGGDTKGAVELRDGHFDAEKRAELDEPVFKRSEREMLKVVLRILRINDNFKIAVSDIEIKISRSKLDNALNKAEVLQILLNCGVDYSRAIKTVQLFSDPEQVAIESRDRMEILYPTTKQTETAPEDNNAGANNGSESVNGENNED